MFLCISNQANSPQLAFTALNPSIQILAPWRIPEFIERFQSVHPCLFLLNLCWTDLTDSRY